MDLPERWMAWRRNPTRFAVISWEAVDTVINYVSLLCIYIYIYIYSYPPSQNPCFALFSEGCLKQPWECACKSSKQKADACCSFTFTLSLEVYDEQNWVRARIRTSQETMNLVTTKDNWMSLSMCENPHVPGNYEPGDDRRQHETSLDILLHMAGNIVSRVHIWARPQWMSLREATDSGIDWYLLVLDQASLQRSAGKKVELFSPCEAEGSIWTFPTFGCQTWERAWNSIWLERMIMQRLSPVAVVVAEMWISEQLCLNILYIWLWDMGEGIE